MLLLGLAPMRGSGLRKIVVLVFVRLSLAFLFCVIDMGPINRLLLSIASRLGEDLFLRRIVPLSSLSLVLGRCPSSVLSTTIRWSRRRGCCSCTRRMAGRFVVLLVLQFDGTCFLYLQSQRGDDDETVGWLPLWSCCDQVLVRVCRLDIDPVLLRLRQILFVLFLSARRKRWESNMLSHLCRTDVILGRYESWVFGV